MGKIQYQPTKNIQLSDAQEVHYAKTFKKADIAGDYRKQHIKGKNDNM